MQVIEGLHNATGICPKTPQVLDLSSHTETQRQEVGAEWADSRMGRRPYWMVARYLKIFRLAWSASAHMHSTFHALLDDDHFPIMKE